MRKNFGAKTYLYPMPVLVIGTYDEKNIPNAMTAAWGGISDYNQISIALSEEHKTVKNLNLKSCFTVSVATIDTMKISDYVGIVSGNENPYKCADAKLKSEKSEYVDAPIFLNFPLTLECEVLSLNKETYILTGKIVNISVDEKVLDEKGEISVDLLQPITYDPVHHKYIALGKVVGSAFEDGKNI